MSDSVLPEGYAEELTNRIIKARGQALMACLPSGATVSGGDGWWPNKTYHGDGYHQDGTRHTGVSTLGCFKVINDTASRTIALVFSVDNKVVIEDYNWHDVNHCDICDGTAT